MICPYYGSPNIERIGHYLYICYDCGEQFSVSSSNNKKSPMKGFYIDFPFRSIELI